MEGEVRELQDCVISYRAIFDHFLTPLPLLELMPTLRDEARKEIQDLHDRPRKQVDIFFKELLECGESGIYQSFLDALSKSEDQRWIHDFMIGNLNNELTDKFIYHIENAETFKKLFEIIQPQLNVIDARTLVTVLRPWLSKGEKDDLNEKCNRLGSTYALPWIIDFILRKKPTWLKELYNHAEEGNYSNEVAGTLAKALAQYFIFDENNENVAGREEYMECSSQPSTSTGCFHLHGTIEKKENETENSPLNEQQMEVGNEELNENVDEGCRVKQQSAQEDDDEDLDHMSLSSDEFFDAGNEIDTEPCDPYQTYELRGYQHELTYLARQGKNVIVCAPPGAGKTLVAANIIQNYYETSCRDDETKRNVLFFTPGIALAQQQHDRFKEYLPPKYKTDYRCGNGDRASLLAVKDLDVVILTPQLLVNDLNSDKNDKSAFKLDEFGMLIFDECHHCKGGDPYNKLMRHYFRLENDSKKLPQVIGLTATLGMGKVKTNKDSALQEMKRLCANLNAIDGVVTVHNPQNRKEMEKYIANPDESHLLMDMERNDPFFEEVITLMTNIEQVLIDLEEEPISRAPDFRQNDFDRDMFKQWCVKAKEEIAESNHSRDAYTCVEYLEVCGDALDLYYICRPEAALEKLLDEALDSQKQETRTEKLLHQYHTDALNTLKEVCDDPRCVNPNLGKIKKCILEKFETVSDSRIMLMTQMKVYAYALKDWMNDDEQLKVLKPVVFTGTQTSAGVKGLSQQAQRKTIKSFKSGQHKILISTPHAAGEGIDVADCNLVINYNFLRNESLTVQIKGRVRKRGGEMVHISSDRVARRDRLNVYRTQLMNECTDNLVHFIQNNQKIYREELKNLNTIDMREVQSKVLRKLEESRVGQANDEFLLYCKKCKVLVCSSFDFVVVDNQQYVNITPGFKAKYKMMEHPRKDKKDGMSQDWKKISKVVCKNCNLDWGIEALYKGAVALPLIKIKGFRITKKATTRHYIVKQWKNVPFKPQEISLDTILKRLCDED